MSNTYIENKVAAVATPPGVSSSPAVRKKRIIRNASVVGDKAVYEDDLDKFVLKEYFRFLPALAYHHMIAQASSDRNFTRSDDVHFVRSHWMATMLVDISGFTRISQAIGAEHTKKHCNAFFSRLLQVIAKFRGDVLKFLGDSMLVVWPLHTTSDGDDKAATCLVCAECAAALMCVGEYDVQDVHQRTKEPYMVKLRLHCGLACGTTQFFCVGQMMRSEIILGGEVLQQLGRCESEAKQGEVIVSNLFKHYLTSLKYESSKTENGNFSIHWRSSKGDRKKSEKPSFVRRISSFRPKFSSSSVNDDDDDSNDVNRTNRDLSERLTGGSNPRRRTLQYRMDGHARVEDVLTSCSICEESQQKQYYAFHETDGTSTSPGNGQNSGETSRHRRRGSLKYRFRQRTLGEVKREFDVVFGNDASLRVNDGEDDCISLAEEERTPNKSIRWRIRSLVHEQAREAVDNDMLQIAGDICHICTLFIRLDELIPRLTDGDLDSVQSAFMALYLTVMDAGGTLRQFAQDDKGCVGIAAFGVPGLPHSHIEDRALGCALDLLKSLRNQGIRDCGVGIATGDVFCGFVGAHHRCEWAVMGPSVNLSARLMSNASGGRVLIDHETYKKLHNSTEEFDFEPQAPVIAKGYVDPVRVFRPFRIAKSKAGGTLAKSNSEKKVYRKRKLGRINSTTDLIPMEQIQRIKSLATFDLMVLKIASVAAYGQRNDAGVVNLRMLSYALKSVGHSNLSRIMAALDRLTVAPALIAPQCNNVTSVPKDVATDSVSSSSRVPPAFIKRCLERHLFFKALVSSSVRSIVNAMVFVEKQAGDVIFSHGDNSRDLYVIESGVVSLIVDDHEVDSISKGGHFGDLSVLFESKRPETARVKSKACVLWKLPASIYTSFCSNASFRFVSNPVRKSVYGQILKKHLKRYHGVAARYLMLQQNAARKRAMFDRTSSRSDEDAVVRGMTADPHSKADKEDLYFLRSAICQHMHLSNVSLISKVSQLKKFCKQVAQLGRHDEAVDWLSRLVVLALSLDETTCREVVEIFYVEDTGTKKGRSGTKVAPQNSSRYGAHPIQTQFRGGHDLRAVMPGAMSTFTAVVSQIMSTKEPSKGAAMLLAGWLLDLATSYMELDRPVLAFNIAQVVLIYLGCNPVPVQRKTFWSLSMLCISRSLRWASLVRRAKAELSKRPSSWVTLAQRAYALEIRALRTQESDDSDLLYIAGMLNTAALDERKNRRSPSYNSDIVRVGGTVRVLRR